MTQTELDDHVDTAVQRPTVPPDAVRTPCSQARMDTLPRVQRPILRMSTSMVPPAPAPALALMGSACTRSAGCVTRGSVGRAILAWASLPRERGGLLPLGLRREADGASLCACFPGHQGTARSTPVIRACGPSATATRGSEASRPSRALAIRLDPKGESNAQE